MEHEDDLLQKQIKDSLNTGMVIKNYKELCSILNLPVVTGKQKILQLVNLERFIDFEKEKQKFIITEIYDTPEEKTDKRRERGVYTKYIQIILMDMLVNHYDSDYTYIGTKSDLLLELGMQAMKYNNQSYAYLADKIPGLQSWEYENYYNWSSKRLTDILKYSLQNLADAKLIDYRIEKVPYIRNNDNLVPLILNDEVIKTVLEIENKTLKELGYESIKQINSKNKWREYYYKRNKIAGEYDYVKIQDQYHIVYLEKSIREMLEKEKLELQKMLLNDEIVSMLKRTSETLINSKNKEADQKLEYIIEQRPKIKFGNPPMLCKEFYGIPYYDDIDVQSDRINQMIDMTIKNSASNKVKPA